eukprot:COSAG01_NODE_66_length_29241_cov_17.772768_21_plen_103_part_00
MEWPRRAACCSRSGVAMARSRRLPLLCCAYAGRRRAPPRAARRRGAERYERPAAAGAAAAIQPVACGTHASSALLSRLGTVRVPNRRGRARLLLSRTQTTRS